MIFVLKEFIQTIDSTAIIIVSVLIAVVSWSTLFIKNQKKLEK